jgi:hypothetical protein
VSPREEAKPAEALSASRHPGGDQLKPAIGDMARDLRSVGRVVSVSILVALLWKLPFFVFAFRVYADLPLRDGFFPGWLQLLPVSAGAFLIAVTAVGATLFCRSRWWLQLLTAVSTTALAVLVIHQHSYNDVTFFTCAWASLWCHWWFGRLADEPAGLLERGAFLAHLILSVILFGGGVGKLTPGYWSGEVLYEIYFSGRDYWLFNLLRGNFEEPELRTMAAWYSRFVILTELSCGALWLLPRRTATWLAIAVLLGIALASNTNLFSVVTCLLGLAVVGLHAPRNHLVRGSRSGPSTAAEPTAPPSFP